MKESALSKKIVDYIRSVDGCWARKVYSGGVYATAGEPDIDAVIRGRPLKIEVKLPGRLSTVSALQREALARWAAAGAVAIVVTSVDEVRKIVADIAAGEYVCNTGG